MRIFLKLPQLLRRYKYISYDLYIDNFVIHANVFYFNVDTNHRIIGNWCGIFNCITSIDCDDWTIANGDYVRLANVKRTNNHRDDSAITIHYWKTWVVFNMHPASNVPFFIGMERSVGAQSRYRKLEDILTSISRALVNFLLFSNALIFVVVMPTFFRSSTSNTLPVEL